MRYMRKKTDMLEHISVRYLICYVHRPNLYVYEFCLKFHFHWLILEGLLLALVVGLCEVEDVLGPLEAVLEAAMRLA